MTNIENEETPKSSNISNNLPFEDIQDNKYYDSIKYLYEKGIMVGTSKNRFSPSIKSNRASIINLLYNMDKEKISKKHTFNDVASGTWYENALSWASEHFIIKGEQKNKFYPNDLITKQEFAIILLNYAKYKSYKINNLDNLSNFSDYKDISNWSKEAFSYMVDLNLINYTDENNKLNPKSILTREQVAVMIHKFLEENNK